MVAEDFYAECRDGSSLFIIPAESDPTNNSDTVVEAAQGKRHHF
jgi:hypothetical protein